MPGIGNYEDLVEDKVTTSSKLYARYANLPTDWLELDTTTDTYYVKRGTTSLSNITSLVIPAMYNGKKVTSIMSSASTDTGVFYQQGFSQVSLPNTLIKIGDNAFYGSGVLQSIIIPNTVTSIGSGAFSCCSSLQDVTVSDNILAIGN